MSKPPRAKRDCLGMKLTWVPSRGAYAPGRGEPLVIAVVLEYGLQVWLPVFVAIAAGAVAALGFLVLRLWWWRRQNPPLPWSREWVDNMRKAAPWN